MARGNNYEIFKQDALKRFLTFDQEQLIQRLDLEHDENYIYIEYIQYRYRFSRKEPLLERLAADDRWENADVNEALTLCDLLCHTTDPLLLTGDFLSLQSLNRVKAGTTQTVLGKDMFYNISLEFDQKDEQLRAACEALQGVAAGKGDVAYEIPIFGPIHIRFSFYSSDDEFEPQMTMMFPSDICTYLHYETLYYLVGTVIERLKERMAI